MEPPVEAQMEVASVEEPVAVVEEPPEVESTAEEANWVPRRAAGDEDAGWLDAWAGEEAAGAAEETGPQLGTEVSDDLATTTTTAEAGLEGPHDFTTAAAAAADADAADTAADADILASSGPTTTRLGEEELVE